MKLIQELMRITENDRPKFFSVLCVVYHLSVYVCTCACVHTHIEYFLYLVSTEYIVYTSGHISLNVLCVTQFYWL